MISSISQQYNTCPNCKKAELVTDCFVKKAEDIKPFCYVWCENEECYFVQKFKTEKDGTVRKV